MGSSLPDVRFLLADASANERTKQLPGKLPEDNAEIQKLLDGGMTQQQVADLFGVSRQAVSYRYAQMQGVRNRRTHRSHKDFFPWKIKSEHITKPPHRNLYRRLIEVHSYQEGWPQTPEAQAIARNALEWLAGKNAYGVRVVINYDPDEGFWAVPAREGDGPIFVSGR